MLHIIRAGGHGCDFVSCQGGGMAQARTQCQSLLGGPRGGEDENGNEADDERCHVNIKLVRLLASRCLVCLRHHRRRL